MKKIIIIILISIYSSTNFFAQIIPNMDGMKTEYSGRKAYQKQQRENILKFNAEHGVTTKNLDYLNYIASQERINEGTTSNLYNSLNGNWSVVPFAGSNFGMGRVECIAFHPTNNNIFYIGAAGGGVWKTENNGVSYTPLTDYIPCGGISSIVIDPNNTNILYILTGASLGGQSNTSIGVFKSLDGGNSWLPTGLQDSITTNNEELYAYKLIMKPGDSNTLFASTSSGLFKTTDAGESWDTVKYGNIIDIEFHPSNPNTMYITQYGKEYFYFCTDGAIADTSWTESYSYDVLGPYPVAVSGFFSMMLAVTPAAPNDVYAMLTCDRPNRFEHISFYSHFVYNSQLSNKYIPDVLPTVVSDWCGANIDTLAASGGGRSYSDILVDNNNSQNVIVGGLNFYAKDVNNVWQLKNYDCSNNVSRFHVDVGMIAQRGNEMFVTTDGGVNRQIENYSSPNEWTNITASIEIAQPYGIDGSPQDEDVFILGLQDNGVHLRNSSSYSLYIGGDGTAAAIDQTDKDIFYGTIQNGELFYKFDHSVPTYMRVPGPSCMCPDSALYSGTFEFSKCFQIDKNDPLKLYYMKRDMYYSSDRGANWTRYITGLTKPAKMMRVAKSNNSYWYFISELNEFKKTINFGSSFTNVTPPVSASIIKDLYVSDDDPNVIYITCLGNVSDKKVYKSTNGGNSWTNLSIGLPNVSINCITLDENTNDIYVGTDIGIYVRPNNANHWISFNNGLPITQVYDLYVNPGYQTINAGLFGRGIAKSNLFSYSGCQSFIESLGNYKNRYTLSVLDSIKANATIVGSATSNVKFSAQNGYVRLTPGFTAHYNSTFIAEIAACGGSSVTGYKTKNGDIEDQVIHLIELKDSNPQTESKSTIIKKE